MVLNGIGLYRSSYYSNSIFSFVLFNSSNYYALKNYIKLDT